MGEHARSTSLSELSTFETRESEFLSVLASGKSVTAAATAIGLTRQAAYQRRANHPDFAAKWDDAIEQGTDRLEDTCHQRAEEKSDLLMIFTLKARRPHKWRDNASISLSGHVTLEGLVAAIATEKAKEIEHQRQAAVDEANTIDVKAETNDG